MTFARRTNPRSARRAGFTLMEMVTSCIVISIMMLSLGYALKLALVSTGTGATQAAASLDAADVVERLTDDLNEANGFSQRTAAVVTFTVPDRGPEDDADADDDKIRYEYFPTAGNIVIPGSGSGSGSSGSGGGGLLGGLLGSLLGGGSSSGSSGSGSGDTLIPVPAYTLTRKVNEGPTSVVARDLRAFDLKYVTRTMTGTRAASAPPTDKLLWEYVPDTISVPGTYDLSTARFIGQTFLPSAQLPGGTTSYSITRVQVQLKSDAVCDGMLAATIRRISTNIFQANWPLSGAANIVDTSSSVAEVSLADQHVWAEFRFTGANGLNPATKLAFVIQGVSGTAPQGNASSVTTGLPLPPGSTWMVQTTNGNVASPSWTASSLSSLKYRVYGNTVP